MTTGRTIETFILDWQGITLSVTYEAHWMNSKSLDYAHLQVESITPARAPLPVTETGYRSHFLSKWEIEDAGGPPAYVRQWLDYTAASKTWQVYQEQCRQFTLF